MREEPEAVSADAQDEITRDVQRDQDVVWMTSRARILAELEHLATHLKSPHVRRSARAIEREVESLDRKLTHR